MTSAKLNNYLKTFRKRSGLSQDEMSFLLGTQSGAKISRYEWGHRDPSLRTLLGYEVIFAASSKELFAGITESVEASISETTKELIAKLQTENPNRIQTQKLAFLNAMSLRLNAETPHEKQQG